MTAPPSVGPAPYRSAAVGVALVGFAVLTWALVPVGVRFLPTALTSTQVVFARFLVGLLLLTPWVLVRWARPARLRATVRELGVGLLGLGLLGVVLPQLALTWSVRNLPVGLVSFLAYSNGIFAMVFAALLLRERRLRAMALPIALLAAGMALLFYDRAGLETAGATVAWPWPLVALTVPVLWGLTSALAKHLLGKRRAPPLLLAWWRVAVACVVLAPFFVLGGGLSPDLWGGLGPGSLALLFLLGALPVALGLPAYMAGLRRLSLGTTSAIEAFTAPLGAAFAGLLIPTERLATRQWVGGVLLLSASLLSVVLTSPRVRARPPPTAGAPARRSGVEPP